MDTPCQRFETLPLARMKSLASMANKNDIEWKVSRTIVTKKLSMRRVFNEKNADALKAANKLDWLRYVLVTFGVPNKIQDWSI